MKKKLFAAFTAACILCSFCACAQQETPAGNETTAGIAAEPTDAPAYPELLSYEAYMKMTPAQQQAYYETFPDQETYMQWFNTVALAYREEQGEQEDSKVEGNVGIITQPTDPEKTDAPVAPSRDPEDPTEKPETPTTKPTDPTQKPTVNSQENKDPVLLTYEEYLKLTPAQQQTYYESFPSHEAYMQWSDAAVKEYNKNHTDDIPVENEGQITQPEETDAPQEDPEPTKEQDVLDGYGTVTPGRE